MSHFHQIRFAKRHIENATELLATATRCLRTAKDAVDCPAKSLWDVTNLIDKAQDTYDEACSLRKNVYQYLGEKK